VNRKQLIILGVAAAGFTLLALILGNLQSERHEGVAYGRVYPQLEAALSDINHLSIQHYGEPEVNIRRSGDHWAVVEKGGYKADMGLLGDALHGLAQLELIEAKTSNPENYAKLGVVDPSSDASEATRIRLWNTDVQLLADILIGKSANSGGMYVRKSAHEQSWLTASKVSFPSKSAAWLDKGLLNIEMKRIQRIEMKTEDGAAYILSRLNPAQAEFKLEPLPQGTSLKQNQVQSVATALSNLSLSDVLPGKEVPSNDSAWRHTIFKTFDGLVVDARTRALDEKHHLKLKIGFDAQRAAQQEQGEGKSEEVAGQSVAKSDVEHETSQLEDKFKNWIFIIPSYKASTLSLSYEELVENGEKETSDADEGKGIGTVKE
jgi:hypothetical protein